MMTQKNSNMINMNPSEIIHNRLVESFGLKTYEEIQDTFNKVDVSTDKDFQKKFNGFYKVRKGPAWRKDYYDLFEEVKNDHDHSKQNFEYILRSIYEKTCEFEHSKSVHSEFEPSFSSKMLATLNPNYPIWDQYVLKNTGTKVPSVKNINSLVATYKEIELWYKKFIVSPAGKTCIAEFDENFPDYNNINDVKKIDFLLWAKR